MSSQQHQRSIQALCQRYQAVILEHTSLRLHVAVSVPASEQMIEALRFASQCDVEVECWPQARLEQYSQQAPPVKGASEQTINDARSASAVELVNQTLLTALQRRASDIHFEPQADHLRIRLRIDGMLQTLKSSDDNVHATLIARLKILGNLDIAERRMPQDGQFSLKLGGKTHSFRLSTLPTHFGEKAVIRLLHSEEQAISLDKLGMSGRVLERYRDTLALPQGLILVTGPTGSGKTFTLYSGLNTLNSPEKNLCSVEDPIEIPLAGVNQTQINPKSGLDFHRVLRALLRQDPDVIMLGEIRDGETAEIAVKAAQTGHLVLSTLHTNSTAETITRLGQMGIPSYLLASALKLVIAQRLVRRLCPHCRQPAEAVAHFPSSIWPGTVQTWQASGCDHCFSGYYGRLALFEILPVTSKLQIAIAANATPDVLISLAQQQGLNTLFTEGLHAVNRGETSLEEVNRIVGFANGE
nr:type II secretion system protein GspE [Pantoea sp. 201603H]